VQVHADVDILPSWKSEKGYFTTKHNTCRERLSTDFPYIFYHDCWDRGAKLKYTNAGKFSSGVKLQQIVKECFWAYFTLLPCVQPHQHEAGAW